MIKLKVNGAARQFDGDPERYEATNYETASLKRVIEIARALAA